MGENSTISPRRIQKIHCLTNELCNKQGGLNTWSGSYCDPVKPTTTPPIENKTLDLTIEKYEYAHTKKNINLSFF